MATYYVTASDANTGDVNTGAHETPFTLAESMELANRAPSAGGAQPGDTFLFLAGTYRNASYGDGDIWKSSADTIIKLNDVHGTAEAPITFAAAPGEDVKLQYDGNGAITIRGSSYIKIEGFEIEGPGGTVTLQDALDAQFQYRVNTGTAANPVYTYHEIDPAQPFDLSGLDTSRPFLFNSAAIALPNGSHHIEITGNTIHDATAHAISAHGRNDYITVTGNEIYDNVRYTSVGGHAISFKGLDSGTDTSDAVRISVTNNYLHDNNNLLVSWAPDKTSVHVAIDEGKSIHVQDATAAGNWDHGLILIANNLIERAGNAAITANNADRMLILNNTIVDAGYLNEIIEAGGADPLAPDFRVNAGIRLAGGIDNVIANNLISLSDSDVFAVDADPTVTSANTMITGNIVAGGAGFNFRADAAALSAGFTAVADIGFADAAAGDYRLTSTSPAVDAANARYSPPTDITGDYRAAGPADVGAYELGAVPEAELTPRQAHEAALVAAALAAGLPLADYSTTQAVDTLANLSFWRPAFATGYPTITYSFPVVTGAADQPDDYDTDGRNGTLRTFSELQAESARLAVAIYDDFIPLSFVEQAADPNADMRFFNSTILNTAGGAPAGTGIDGDVWIYNYDQNPPDTRDWSPGAFYFGYWFLHEVGHTLGLSHAGGYPGAGYNGLNYVQDSVVYTVMSYNFSASGGATWSASASTPMVNDIAAIHAIYGADMTTRTGDTVYGFNSNAGRLPYDFDAMLAQEGKVAPMTIWDAGGIDTLDLSGFGQDAAIDISEGGYSNAGGQTMAIGIAYGAVIENAVGGAGNDRMWGNATGNTLNGEAGDDTLVGGAGNDSLDGGADSDTARLTGNRADYTTAWDAELQLLALTDKRSGHDGSDTIANVESFAFADVTQLLAGLLANAPSDIAIGTAAIAEDANLGAIVGTLSATDADAGDTFSYTLLDDAGGRFALLGDKLTVAAGLDFETATSHAVKVKVTDGSGNTYSELLAIGVGNVSEGPAAVSLSAAAIAENKAAGSVVATLASADSSGGPFTYTLAAGPGGTDNAAFSIAGNQLHLNLAANYEAKASYAIRLKVTDAGGTAIEQTAVITVANVSPEIINGTAATNRLTGGSDIDRIFGFAGNDVLSGLGHNDVITGGRGRDIMLGGTGLDDFDFNLLGEMGRTALTRDIIRDFIHLRDDIDLSTIDANGSAAGNAAFKLLAAKGAAFTGVKGQLHWYQLNPAGTLHDKTIVEGDVNGDKRADFQIELTGLKTLTAADFIL